MKNILIVCADKILRQDISKALGRELGFLYADIDDILDYELLGCEDTSIVEANDKMQQLEVKSIVKALSYDRCVLTISNNMFVSNSNFSLFNIPKVFIRLSKGYTIARLQNDINRMEQELLMFDKINSLISINCEITVDKDVKSVEDIVQYIKQELAKIN